MNKKALFIGLSVVLVLCIGILLLNIEYEGRNNDEYYSQLREESKTEDTRSTAETPVTDACEHLFGQWVTVRQATCGEDGESRRSCSKCSAFETELIPRSLNHTTVADSASPSTCAQSGRSAGSHCSVCGTVLQAQTELPLAPHTYDNDRDSACNACGFTRDVNCKHGTTVTLPAITPTCKANGLTAGAKCSLCQEILTVQAVIAPTGHTDGTWITDKDPTCTEAGSKHRICSVCSETVKTESIPKTGHVPGSWITDREASCGQAGSKHLVCLVCNGTMQTESISRLPCTPGEWQVVTVASCKSAGFKKQFCSVCNSLLDTASIPATGQHNYVNGKCTSCGDEIVGSSFLKYQLSSDRTYYICVGATGYTAVSEIIIPSYYNGLPVKEVGVRNGLDNVGKFRDTKKLVIMEGIERINSHAFYTDFKMEEAYLPSTLKYIGDDAFAYCDYLRYVEMPYGTWNRTKPLSGSSDGTVYISDPITAAEVLRNNSYKIYTR
ncbi:MAG: leucine-rich repeat protein [Clostridia bacterium]|nr:leucine-rich repeat protein [Clostridia bacterium]